MTNDEREKLKIWLKQYDKFLTQVQRQALQLYLEKNLPLAAVATELATTRQAAHDAVKKGIAKLQSIATKLA